MAEFKVDIENDKITVVPEMSHEDAKRMMQYLSDYMSMRKVDMLARERENRFNVVKELALAHMKGKGVLDCTYHELLEILKDGIFEKLDSEFCRYVDLQNNDVTSSDYRVWFESFKEVNISNAQLSEMGIIDSRARELIDVSKNIETSVRRHTGYVYESNESAVKHGVLVSVRIDKELVLNREYTCP